MPIKSTTTIEGGKKENKGEKIQKNLQNKSKNKNNKRFSWFTAARVLSLSGSHSPPYLPRMSSNTVLISGPAVGANQILIWSYFCVFLPPMSAAIRTSVFSFIGALGGLLYIPETQDLPSWICSLYSWWEGFGSSLATFHLGFNCGFTSTSTCGSSTGVCSWGCPGGLEFALVRARCGGGAAAWVTGVLAAPGTQGSWQLGQQEIQCSRRVGQPVLASMLQYSCLENPPPW